MDKLQQYAHKHRELFNSYELTEGFDRRFEHRLQKHRSHRIRHLMAAVTALAACVALLLWLQPHFSGPDLQAHHSDAEPAFADVSLYYTQQMDDLMARICRETAQRSPQAECMLCAEAQRIYDEKTVFEQGEMTRLLPDTQSLAVLYTFYSTKLDNLQLLLTLARQN